MSNTTYEFPGRLKRKKQKFHLDPFDAANLRKVMHKKRLDSFDRQMAIKEMKGWED